MRVNSGVWGQQLLHIPCWLDLIGQWWAVDIGLHRANGAMYGCYPLSVRRGVKVGNADCIQETASLPNIICSTTIVHSWLSDCWLEALLEFAANPDSRSRTCRCIAKVILRKAASSPRTDGLIVFAEYRTETARCGRALSLKFATCCTTLRWLSGM